MTTSIELNQSFCINGQWDTHAALRTVNHQHFSVYDSDPSCDLMIVETGDGRFFIGESFAGDGRGHPKVFCEDGEGNMITLYSTLDEAVDAILEVLSELTGQSIEHLRKTL